MTTLLVVLAINWLAFPVAALLLLLINGPWRVYGWLAPCIIADAGPFLVWCFENPLTSRLSGGFRARAFTWACVVFTFGARLRPVDDDVRLVRHETHHARWSLMLGLVYVAIYLGAMPVLALMGKRPYDDNPFEVAANRAEEKP